MRTMRTSTIYVALTLLSSARSAMVGVSGGSTRPLYVLRRAAPVTMLSQVASADDAKVAQKVTAQLMAAKDAYGIPDKGAWRRGAAHGRVG